MRVVVLGAGVVGVSIADALAQRGVDVTVLDRRSPGRGATFASAGMLAPFAEGHGDARLRSLLQRGLTLFDNYVSALVADTGLAVEYARTGTLEIALDGDDADRLAGAKRDLDVSGIASELLTGRELCEREPAVSPQATAGLFTPTHGFVGVHGLVSALVHRAKFAGAVFESPVEACSVETTRDGVTVEAEGRQYQADAAVVAAGCWSRRVRVRHVAAFPVRPVRGQLLDLKWTGARPPKQIVWGSRCYTVPWADGTLLVGATLEDAGFDESATVAGMVELGSAVTSLLPGAAAAQFRAVRVGLRPALPDGLPAIGPIARSPRVIVATGHYRNGVLLAPLTADLVSRYLVDGVEDEVLKMTTPDRFLGA